jgi:dTDP-glucose 4,6-dehydratase
MNAQPIPVYGNGQQIREWIYVKDHFKALIAIIESGVPGEIYNISTERGLTNMETLNTIFDVMGGGQDLIEHVEDRLGHDQRYAVSSAKLRELGWEPRYDFKEAIAHTISWYKKNQHWFGGKA